MDRQRNRCRVARNGWLWAATNKVQDGVWLTLLDDLNHHQLRPFEEWTGEQAATHTGSDKHASGVYEPTAATVQPALLARGLRRVALEKGIRIHQHTPMRLLKRSHPPSLVVTRGSITADKVVIAMNGGTPRSEEVASYLRWLYPDFKDVSIASHWTGPIDCSLSGLPFFGRLGGRADIICSLGFSGNGVGPMLIGAKMLSSLVLNERDELSECALIRDSVGQFPREPLRYFGGSMVTKVNRRKEALEDQDKTPGTLTRYFAKLAPAGLVPVKSIGVPDD